MGRQPCCDRAGLKRGPWTMEEDRKFMHFIINNGIQCWRMVPKLAGLLRCGKSCRLRWINYLRPYLKRGTLSEAEEDQIIELHARLGNSLEFLDERITKSRITRILELRKSSSFLESTQPPTNILRTRRHGTKNEQLCNIVSTNANTYVDCAKIEEMGLKNDMDSKSDYNMVCKNFDANAFANTNQQNATLISENTNSSIGESSLNGGDYTLQQWVDGVDSLLLWDSFNQQEDLFFLLGNY